MKIVMVAALALALAGCSQEPARWHAHRGEGLQYGPDGTVYNLDYGNNYFRDRQECLEWIGPQAGFFCRQVNRRVR